MRSTDTEGIDTLNGDRDGSVAGEKILFGLALTRVKINESAAPPWLGHKAALNFQSVDEKSSVNRLECSPSKYPG